MPSPSIVPESTTPCLIVLVGSEKGAIYTLEEGDTTLGRFREKVDIILNNREISRALATITLSEGRVSVKDLNSTNGVFVNGERIRQSQLRGGDQLALGSDVVLQVSFQDHTVRSLMENLYRGATRDELTGVFNRSSFFSRLKNRRSGHIAMVDIDKFKLINDRWGHAAGDVVLKELAQRIRQNLGSEGVVGRLGGEEFVLYIGPKVAEPRQKCEEILKSVSSRNFRVDGSDGESNLKVTVSVGLAKLSSDPEADMRRADAALYRAKSDGRDRVVLAED